MPYRYLSLTEEDAWRTQIASNASRVLKILNESINTTRDDFYPDTTEYWTHQHKAEGPFRTSGDFVTLIDPINWPYLLVYFISDSSPTAQGSSVFDHEWLFGANESVSTTGVKQFTTKIGVGIERDRVLRGCVIESLSIEAIAREVVSCTATIIGSGRENLWPAQTPVWTGYSQPYLTFHHANTMTVGVANRLTTAPVIEAFRLTLTRGWDADHYVLSDRFLGAPTLSGMATVEGSMDFSFTSQDEHERFLGGIGTYTSGDQTSWATVLMLRGATAAGGMYYEVEFTIPATYYTASTANVSARDRIVQTCTFKGIYDSSEACGCKIRVRNMTATYT